MKYRAEIDGLRAVAVVPVILFHAGFEVFSGGFVGVDVFFVISGYLITSILIDDLESDQFSMSRFYERRARRILPALFLVMAACIPFAWLWMQPNQMKDFSLSLIAVTLFGSNILFWLESDYFGLTAEEKPLLHTWSLAVEEQYYLLFPIVLLMLWRFGKQRAFWTICLLATASLLLSEWGWRNKASANFFLSPTRAWELFAGSIAAFVIHWRGVGSSNFWSMTGLAAIVTAIFVYDETTPFPSVYGLAPVVGVVLLVLYADSRTWVARILSSRLFVGIGLVSYSAYLWHQPLFAFARIQSLAQPPGELMALLSLASILLAFVSYRFVETPLRRTSRLTRTQVFWLSGVGGLCFAAYGLAGSTVLLQESPTVVVEDAVIEKQKAARFEPKQAICIAKSWKACNDPEEGKTNVLIIGDSHSTDALNAIYHVTAPLRSSVSFATSSLGGCAAYPNTEARLTNTWPDREKCIALNATQRFNAEFLARYDTIAVNFMIGDNYSLQDLIAYVDYLSSHYQGAILLFGGSFAFHESLPGFLNRGYSLAGIEQIFKYNPREDDDLLRRFSAERNIVFLSKFDAFCDESRCSFASPEGLLMSYDTGHLSLYFANLLGEVYRDEILQRIFDGSVLPAESSGSVNP